MICILLALVISSAAAAEPDSSSRLAPCKSQVELYCPKEAGSKNVRGILDCLAKNNDRLSTECKQEIQRFAKASQQTAPPGGGPLGSLGGLAGPASQVPSISYEGRYAPGTNGSSRPSLFENNLSTSIPFYKTDKNTVAATLSGANLHLGSAVPLSSGISVPTNLYRAEAGLQFSRRLPGQRNWGVRGAVGYSGDKFSANTQSFSASANYGFPGSERSYWVLMVLMSNNSPLGTFIPFPGFLYIYRAPTFTGVFGLPIVSLQWTPVSPWSFSLSAFGPQIKAEASYGAVDRRQYFAAVNWKQERFILSERRNKKDRLTLEEKNAAIGMRQPLYNRVLSELQMGYSFDRSFYIGEKLLKRDGGEAKIGAAWFLSWSVKIAL
jgi:hypothetical protein